MVFNGNTWSKATDEPAFNDSEVVLSCADPTFCLAVSGNGQYTTWDGSTWAPPASTPLGKTSFATTISCPTSVFCMLLNGSQDGTTGAATTAYTTWRAVKGWSAVQRLTQIDISSVSCLRDSFCMAIGETTTPNGNGGYLATDISMKWNGSSWGQPMKMEDPNAIPPYGATGIGTTGKISCAASDSCMVVGGFHASGDIFTLWNGTNWSHVIPDTAGTGVGAEGFSSVSCPSTSLCVATDYGSGTNGSPSTFKPPVISTWRAGTWSGTTDTNLQGGSDVSCPSINFCVIVSSGRYWDGTS